MKIKNDYYDPIFTIGVASEMSGISAHSFRQYENEGLILSHKTSTGQRRYSKMELDKVRCIKNMIQDQGLNFEGIRQLMAIIPCWKLRNCMDQFEEKCKLYKTRKRPCWSTKEKCSHPMDDCRECDVYRKMISCDDIKKYIID